MVNEFKKTVFKLIDKVLAQEGYVLAIRKWAPASMYEIDLHLPGVDMDKWTTIPRLKIKVDESGVYRDYTPATWDAGTRTCRVLIETDHEGFGSRWAKNLATGDQIIFAPAHAAPLPAVPGKIAGFGDGSALGHFLALKQLTDRAKYPLRVFIFLNEIYALPDHFVHSHPEFEFIMKPKAGSLDTLGPFIEKKAWADHAAIYIAGYIPMVSGLRKIFKNTANVNARIYAHGFWS
jgi:NADPH-dependent ferric siderophore reductase